MPDPEIRKIIRQWDREIEDQHRREQVDRDDGPWRIVSWVALWLLWLAALVLIVELIKPLHW